MSDTWRDQEGERKREVTKGDKNGCRRVPSGGAASGNDRERRLVGQMWVLGIRTLQLGTWFSEAGLGGLSKQALESPVKGTLGRTMGIWFNRVIVHMGKLRLREGKDLE